MLRPPLLLLSACLLTLWLCSPPCAQGEATRVRYAGQLIQRDAQGTGVPVRTFALHAWLLSAGDGKRIVCRVDDDGRSGLAWYERVTAWEQTSAGTGTASRARLRHEHDGRSHLLTLPSPLVAHPGELSADSEWTADWEGRSIAFSVTGQERAGERTCWKIEGASNTGRRQTLQVEQGTDLLVSATLRVFIGQGERFDLVLRLEEVQPLAGEAGDVELAALTAVAELQAALLGKEEAVKGPLTPTQLSQVESALPGLQQSAAGTSWERFVQAVAGDVTADRQRLQSLEKLAARYLGKATPAFELIGLDGRPIDRQADAGQVVVLHFWDYRGTPEAPFGQVGYLDFLAGRRKGDGVRVYGVAVDERLADAGLSAAVRREVRQFSSQFIRVSYPIAVDDGSLLATFGDPRGLGAPLPLWVVIGRDGTVVNYKAGLYSIDASRGLEELNAEITKALAR